MTLEPKPVHSQGKEANFGLWWWGGQRANGVGETAEACSIRVRTSSLRGRTLSARSWSRVHWESQRGPLMRATDCSDSHSPLPLQPARETFFQPCLSSALYWQALCRARCKNRFSSVITERLRFWVERQQVISQSTCDENHWSEGTGSRWNRVNARN
jgi:hypothetical protein